MSGRVYLPRYAHAGLRGPDVLAYSRIYKQLGIRHPSQNFAANQTRFFGIHMVEETREFQHRHGLRADGVVGPRTFDLLRPHFDGYDRYLFRRERALLVPHPRALVVGGAIALYKHRPFRYIEDRPYPRALDLFWLHGSDCSGTSTGCYHYAYLSWPRIVSDPNGLHFDGYGYTGTQLDHGRRVSTPHPGDLVFYYPTYSHVGVYLDGGRVFSHGHTGDPTIIPASWGTQIRSYLPEGA